MAFFFAKFGWRALALALGASALVMLGACATAPIATTADPAPLTAADAFDISQLHAQVRAAVLVARIAETQSLEAARRAREAAEIAEAAAARAARNSAIGVTAYDFGSGHYAGEGAAQDSNGYGVETFVGGDTDGDRYAGQGVHRVKNGMGVYVHAENANNAVGADRYEGSWVDGVEGGYGVFYWHDGGRFAGGELNGHGSGAGVYRWADGRVYEGDYADDKKHGFGVVWAADGQVSEAGIWVQDNLRIPLSGPAPK